MEPRDRDIYVAATQASATLVNKRGRKGWRMEDHDMMARRRRRRKRKVAGRRQEEEVWSGDKHPPPVLICFLIEQKFPINKYRVE